MSCISPFALQTPRLFIRRFLLGEVDDFVSYRNDPYILELQPWLAPLSQAEAWTFFTRQVVANPGRPNTQVHVAIVHHETSQVMGDFFVKVDSSGRAGEIGITLARYWQGKGFEEEALRVVKYWACVAEDGPRLQSLRAMVDARKTPLATSLTAVYKWTGFTRVSQGTIAGIFPYFVMECSI